MSRTDSRNKADGSVEDTREYPLRPQDDDELGRLGLQHRVWKAETDRVIGHAGFRAGDRLADLGCGPGYLAADLARMVGPEGHVLAVDSSELFVDHVRSVAQHEHLPWIDTRAADLSDLALEDESLDGAVLRWVLMFVPEPEVLVAGITRALRSGGRIVVMDYFRFRSSALWPDGHYFGKVYDAVQALIESRGGDPDIGERVPAMLDAAGCDVVELMPILRIGRPGSALWDWMEATGRNHGLLVEEGLLTASDLDGYHREWSAQAELHHAFFSAPPLLATIGCKR